MKTGKIKHIDPNGLWNGLTKYKVTFADGEQYTFFAKGNFKFKIGDDIKYEVTNQEYKNARIPQDQYKEEAVEETSPKAVYVDKNDLIIRQTCVKASSELNAGKGNDVVQVLLDAETMYNWIKQ
tara:strand:+ start:1071 stop:1442 length:372 start_codon:yes stop_codon:yes gene_type:complete